MIPRNHYESAFLQYLQQQEIPFISTRENQRCFPGSMEMGSLKNLDFVVLNRINCLRLTQDLPDESMEIPSGQWDNTSMGVNYENISWLIDIKGRRFPSGQKHPQYWRNWVTIDDLLSMDRWQALFGKGFGSLLVFAYDVVGERSPIESQCLFHYQDRRYAFMAIPSQLYWRKSRLLSPRWRTVCMPNPLFRQCAVPVDRIF